MAYKLVLMKGEHKPKIVENVERIEAYVNNDGEYVLEYNLVGSNKNETVKNFDTFSASFL